MRLARKLLALAIMALATMALSATNASAVEVSDEDSGLHCAPVTLMPHHVVEGGCRVEAVSEKETEVQAFNGMAFVTISTCEDHFEAAIGEDGTGYLYLSTPNGMAGPPCTRTQCDESETGGGETPHADIPWPLALETEDSMEITFCLRDAALAEGIGTMCHTWIDVEETTDHRYEFSASGAVGEGACENLSNFVRVIGHWNTVPTVSHPAIEVNDI